MIDKVDTVVKKKKGGRERGGKILTQNSQKIWEIMIKWGKSLKVIEIDEGDETGKRQRKFSVLSLFLGCFSSVLSYSEGFV